MAIFRVDRIAEKILLLKEKGLGKDKIAKRLSKKHRADTINEALSEIEKMVSRGFFKRMSFKEWLNLDKNLFRNSVISSADLYLAHICNMACSYCCNQGGSFEISFKKKLMDWETARAALDWFFEHNKNNTTNSLTVSFFGGEPLLNKDVFKKSLEYIKNKWIGKIKVPLRLILTTNGTLLDAEILKVISEHKCQLVVSLDASRKEHDRNRVFKNSKGTYDVILNNIKYAKKMFPDIFITITSTTRHDSDFRNIFKYNEKSYCGNMKRRFNIEHSVPLDEAGRKAYFNNVKRELEAHYINRLKNQKSYVYTDPESFGILNNRSYKGIICGAGISKAAVAADGGIYVCSLSLFDKKYKIGSVFTGISRKSKEKIINIYRKLFRLRGKICFKCWDKLNCSGNCIFNKPGKDKKIKFSIQDGKSFACDIKRLGMEYSIRSYETLDKEDIKRNFDGILISNKDNLDIRDSMDLSCFHKDFINNGFKHIKCLNPFYRDA